MWWVEALPLWATLCAPGTVFTGAWLTWKTETVPSPSFETTAVC